MPNPSLKDRLELLESADRRNRIMIKDLSRQLDWLRGRVNVIYKGLRLEDSGVFQMSPMSEKSTTSKKSKKSTTSKKKKVISKCGISP